MAQSDWKTINVKKGLLDEVEKMLQGQTMRNEGITNASQFVDSALKEKIEKLGRKRFEHINKYEDHVKILDNKLDKVGRIVSVYFKDERTWCDYCDENFCVHTQYAWEIPEVRKILQNYGIKSPSSKIT